ncbi:MAG: NADH-quinone oxidoreductase subunit N [Candidatus Poseidonia sp.]|nr:NADH-quinone oxidoreductase subunit N [Poseidonia sp.]
MEKIEPFGEGFVVALAPEFVLVVGLFTLMIVPNLGDAKFRIPLTQIRIPWFFGGSRAKFESDPRLPGLFATSFLTVAFVLATMSFVNGMNRTQIASGDNVMLQVDEFSRMFELIFYGALALASAASVNRMPATTRADRTASGLYNNRRQVDFYILLMTTGLGMSVVALAQDLFLLFIGLELASFSTYVLVSFMKETKEGTEAGMKYFIVGSVASGVGLYGLSLLYLWAGSLQFSALEVAFAANGMESLPLIALGMLLVGFGFKVSAAPFHFAAPDAYAGATAPVAGVLATASKAMGILGLLRVLLAVASPEATDGAAVWLVALGVLSVVTMTWGNIAALGSTNPKRMLAYSSVAHAGYMMAAITAIGALNWEDGHVNLSNDAALVVVTALIFHLTVLVCFKLGAFLVLSLLESEKGGHTLESLGGLAKRDPFLAVAMFVFMMSLAGVPPLSGFVSKLLVIMGIVKVALLDVTVNSDLSFADIHWVWYLALAMVINSAISVFYYLRVGLVMYFNDPEEGREGPLPAGRPVRLAILACLVTTVFFGVGAGQLIALCESAANALVGAW